MMKLFNLYLLSFSDLFSLWIIFCIFFRESFNKKKIFFSIVNMLITSFIVTLFSGSTILFCICIFSLLMISIKDKKQAFLLSLFVTEINEFTKVLSLVLYRKTNFSFVQVSFYNSTLNILALKVFLYLLLIYIYRLLINRLGELPQKIYGLFIALPLSNLLLIYIFLKLMIIFESSFTYLHLLLLLLIILFNIITLIFYLTITKLYINIADLQTTKVLVDEQLKNFEDIETAYTEVRTIRHDLKNHLIIVKSFIQDQKLKECLKYIYSLKQDIYHTKITKYCSNNIVNHILTQKELKASKEGISLTINCFIPKSLEIDIKVLGVILGNALDNAVEANITLPFEKREILLTLRYYNKKIFIEITNSMDPARLKKNFETSKSNYIDHGLGLKSIKKLVEDNSGVISIATNKDKFTITIILFDIPTTNT